VCIYHLPMRATYSANLIFRYFIPLILFSEACINYEAPHYVVFYSLPPLQIFSSAPCSQTPSICVLPLVWETKFHTHKKQQI
jgi:hypothetical protein